MLQFPSSVWPCLVLLAAGEACLRHFTYRRLTVYHVPPYVPVTYHHLPREEEARIHCLIDVCYFSLDHPQLCEATLRRLRSRHLLEPCNDGCAANATGAACLDPSIVLYLLHRYEGLRCGQELRMNRKPQLTPTPTPAVLPLPSPLDHTPPPSTTGRAHSTSLVHLFSFGSNVRENKGIDRASPVHATFYAVARDKLDSTSDFKEKASVGRAQDIASSGGSVRSSHTSMLHPGQKSGGFHGRDPAILKHRHIITTPSSTETLAVSAAHHIPITRDYNRNGASTLRGKETAEPGTEASNTNLPPVNIPVVSPISSHSGRSDDNSEMSSTPRDAGYDSDIIEQVSSFLLGLYAHRPGAESNETTVKTPEFADYIKNNVRTAADIPLSLRIIQTTNKMSNTDNEATVKPFESVDHVDNVRTAVKIPIPETMHVTNEMLKAGKVRIPSTDSVKSINGETSHEDPSFNRFQISASPGREVNSKGRSDVRLSITDRRHEQGRIQRPLVDRETKSPLLRQTNIFVNKNTEAGDHRQEGTKQLLWFSLWLLMAALCLGCGFLAFACIFANRRKKKTESDKH